jgi:hypothetical protein
MVNSMTSVWNCAMWCYCSLLPYVSPFLSGLTFNSWMTKCCTHTTPLKVTLEFPSTSNRNMANTQTYEEGLALAPLHKQLWYYVRKIWKFNAIFLDRKNKMVTAGYLYSGTHNNHRWKITPRYMKCDMKMNYKNFHKFCTTYSFWVNNYKHSNGANLWNYVP